MPRQKGGGRRWLGLALFALVAGLLGSAMLRNEVSLLTTRGSSMFPHFRTGDLAVTVLADRYRVGDIAAYRAKANGAIVLHRIVASDEGGLTFKGDNNSWTDPDHPGANELLGRLWFRIPKAGMIADYTSAPGRTVLLIGGVLILLAGGGAASYRVRGRKRPSGAPGTRRSAPSGRPTGPLAHLPDVASALAGPAVTVAAVLLLVGLAFSTPATRTATDKRTYSQRATYGYTGTAQPGTTYPDGTFSTGDPIFLRLVQQIRIQVDYELAADEDTLHNVAGAYSIDAELSGIGSWRHTIELQPSTRFTGTGFSTEVTLDVPRLQALIEATQAETGVKGDNVKIDLVPRVRTNGFAGEIPVEATFDTPMQLKLTPLDLTPVKEAKEPSELAETTDSTYRAPVVRARDLTFVGRSITVARARVFTLLALVGALAWLGVMVATQRRLLRRPDGDRIAHRYHESIVEVATLPATGPTVEVDDLAALVRIAERADHLILHHHDGDGRHTFVLEDATTTYRFTVDDAPEPETEPEPEPDTALGTEPETEPETALGTEPNPWSDEAVPPPFVGIPPPYVPEAMASVPPAPAPAPPTPPVAAPEIQVQTLDEALRLTALTADELAGLDTRTDTEPS